MNIQITGTRDGVRWPPPGEVKDLPDHEAARLCAAGSAEPVAERAQPEKAVAPAAEKRGGRGRSKPA